LRPDVEIVGECEGGIDIELVVLEEADGTDHQQRNSEEDQKHQSEGGHLEIGG
jgi:hypothetical protein